MADRQKIKEILKSLTNLPNAPDMSADPEGVITEYHQALGHWTNEILDAGVEFYRATETFFPGPGPLNQKILELQMAAAGIPTPGEAWGKVLGAVRLVPPELCPEGERLQSAVDGKVAGEYWDAIHNYAGHKNTCPNCKDGGYREDYGHPIVQATVELLGGRDKLFTDNPAADRKQFIDAYRERVALEGQKYIMPTTVREYMGRALEASGQIKNLAEGMKK